MHICYREYLLCFSLFSFLTSCILALLAFLQNERRKIKSHSLLRSVSSYQLHVCSKAFFLCIAIKGEKAEVRVLPLPLYSHRTSMVLPGTPRYFHCTSGSTEVDEVSLFPPCLIHFEIFRL